MSVTILFLLMVASCRQADRMKQSAFSVTTRVHASYQRACEVSAHCKIARTSTVTRDETLPSRRETFKLVY